MNSRASPVRDEELVAAWRRDRVGGDAARALAVLLDRYRRPVYRWCYGYVRNREAALDLAQDVLLTAYQKLDTLRDGQRFGSWLFMVARNRCLASLRRRERWAGAAVDVDELPAPAPSPEQGLLDSLAVERLLALLDGALDSRERQAIVLRCFERMPVDRITEILCLENATGARGLLQTARRKLRAELARSADPGRGEREPDGAMSRAG
jgi:RNA polymerase sigma-70 factor (ECF subfamily)